MPEAPAVSGLDRERLKIEGAELSLTPGKFSDCAVEVSEGAQPVMCGYPAPYDWTFPYWYLIRFTGASPFGAAALGALEQAELLADLMRWPGPDGSAPGPG